MLLIWLLYTNGVNGDYDKGEDVSLACNPQSQPKRIAWYCDYWISLKQMTTWTDGSGPPSDSGGQWEGRTELDTLTGDIIIKSLELSDNGTYTCLWAEIPIVGIPGGVGDIHTVSVVGNYMLYHVPRIR